MNKTLLPSSMQPMRDEKNLTKAEDHRRRILMYVIIIRNYLACIKKTKNLPLQLYLTISNCFKRVLSFLSKSNTCARCARIKMCVAFLGIFNKPSVM